jgi:SulP family sulfate permease
MSAIDAVNKITDRYKKLNKTVRLKGLSADSRLLLRNAKGIIEVNIDDPIYKVADK